MRPIYTIMFWISVSLVVISIVLMFVFGLKLGVDFRGGSVLELGFKNNRPTISEINKALANAGLKDLNISPSGDRELIVRIGELTEQQHQDILSKVQKDFPNAGLEEKKFDSVGPVIGNELKSKSITAIIIVLIAITVYIAIVFRKLSRFLSPWSMGLSAIMALIHDVAIPAGFFALLGYYYGIEINAVFVAAVLTILGFSVSDTVVVFDRVRENLTRSGLKEEFGTIVHKSILQTLTRSINTTLTTLLSLVAIYFFGGESIKYFSLALIMGFFLGAYSSIFVASPLLVWWNKKYIQRMSKNNIIPAPNN